VSNRKEDILLNVEYVLIFGAVLALVIFCYLFSGDLNSKLEEDYSHTPPEDEI